MSPQMLGRRPDINDHTSVLVLVTDPRSATLTGVRSRTLTRRIASPSRMCKVSCACGISTRSPSDLPPWRLSAQQSPIPSGLYWPTTSVSQKSSSCVTGFVVFGIHSDRRLLPKSSMELPLKLADREPEAPVISTFRPERART
eukprot:CAMPEP_0181256958 /NCGR_PEP_ID=MMETSP1096-20121128/49994_1 /TAXON_ID=156174 ORGANISM="Chrysochromulina ericina, Strain CCMP281" /NCGR_SAMPLE_ID=MMETSP1096 /ASSEMBLY_ACC=CAM_ASM_000453 /LENGTH=142 /DNA_ID=CAMNT_0023355255 /DNA_START=278 /DNA_END=706 /DNA_ORIENTATION=-